MTRDRPEKKRDPLREQLDALAAHRGDPRTPAALLALRQALKGGGGFLVAAAADLIAEAGLAELLPELSSAFQRFLEDGAQRDKGCKAKTAIAAALQRGEWQEPDVFVRGLHHVQREPVWGGSVDTAVELRATCALGLSFTPFRDVLLELAALLADPEAGARVGAARALGGAGQLAAIPLLRFKALLGDEDPQVLAESFGALLLLDAAGSLPFISPFLDHKQEGHRDAAALALGQSRREEALPLLRAAAERERPGAAGVVLLAIAMLHTPAAMDLLLHLVREGARATQAVQALALYKYDEALRARVKEAVEARGNKALREAFLRAFAGT